MPKIFREKRKKNTSFTPCHLIVVILNVDFFLGGGNLFKVKFTQKCLRAVLKSDLKCDINPIRKVFFPAKWTSLIVFWHARSVFGVCFYIQHYLKKILQKNGLVDFFLKNCRSHLNSFLFHSKELNLFHITLNFHLKIPNTKWNINYQKL